jgi:16S rRNA (guanine966-N2)-methyltransferase
MRVIAGTHRGRRLRAPRGAATRPTADRVREAIFSIIGDCTDLRVLDLFAGSGAMGIEALSRGARSVTFVEGAPEAAACIRTNLAALALTESARVVVRDWSVAISQEAKRGAIYDLCLIDPPYSVVAGVSSTIAGALAPLLAEYATVILEGPAQGPVPTMDGIRVIDRSDRSYGSTRVSILRVRGAGVTGES